MIIAIDGPAGSGKSTTARGVAAHLQYYHLDSGLMYRGAAVVRAKCGPAYSYEAFLESLQSDYDATFSNGTFKLHWRGEDLLPALRIPRTGTSASEIAKRVEVRDILVAKQRVLGLRHKNVPGIVIDGRDIGSVVFPDAAVKVYLTAYLEVRARRRHEQLREAGHIVSEAQVLEALRERDAQDKGRQVSPLVKARGATVIDCSRCSVEEQVDAIVQLAREHERTVKG